MPRTLCDDKDRAELLERLRRLQPDSPRQWGTLDAPGMLCHVTDAFRLALGQIQSRPHYNALSRSIGKFLVVNTSLRPPKGRIKAPPETMFTSPSEWSRDLTSCEELAMRVASGEASAVHPAFGPLTPEEWGRMCWKHTDHHLRQFGV
ncbi:MAG TPA: DUF1569 domain-containing protein [Candidatus Eisenbacteria bacterium]